MLNVESVQLERWMSIYILLTTIFHEMFIFHHQRVFFLQYQPHCIHHFVTVYCQFVFSYPSTFLIKHYVKTKMRSLLALPIILVSSLALATPLDERAPNACLQCKPFPTPGDNSQQCDPTTICVTQPGERNYCACRGGYRGTGAFRPGDTSVQVSAIVFSTFST